METVPAMLKERARDSAMDEREREGENFRNETLRDLAAILDDGGAGERERVY